MHGSCHLLTTTSATATSTLMLPGQLHAGLVPAAHHQCSRREPATQAIRAEPDTARSGMLRCMVPAKQASVAACSTATMLHGIRDAGSSCTGTPAPVVSRAQCQLH